ncbi:MAG: hypothetical protein QNJ22_22025 [Desulfosarcinaceae bacterium]|nr:hypothetical protein [Desulfosarcinaceae bacterium]
MSLRYKFKKAEKIVQHLTQDDKRRLEGICNQIRNAERDLNRAASEKLSGCKQACQGLCCRNVLPDDLITEMDALYVWQSAPSLRNAIQRCLDAESLYTADCFFLDDGVGPCIFPADVRPEKCLITFCGDSRSITPEIRALRATFTKLYWFIFFQHLKIIITRFWPRKRP